ncbi:MAG: hypothetical protein AB8V10_05085 [Francisella endosymbiont of Hyalomma asiaticum]
MDGLNKYVTTISIATFVPTMDTTLGMNSCTGVFTAVLAIMTMNILLALIYFLNSSTNFTKIPGIAFIAAVVVFLILDCHGR